MATTRTARLLRGVYGIAGRETSQARGEQAANRGAHRRARDRDGERHAWPPKDDDRAESAAVARCTASQDSRVEMSQAQGERAADRGAHRRARDVEGSRHNEWRIAAAHRSARDREEKR